MNKDQQYIYERSIPEPNTGCWLWIIACNKQGYGICFHDGTRTVAHRVSYKAFKGAIPDGLTIDHLCRVRCCVNPDHLEVVSKSENSRRGNAYRVYRKHPGKPHCKNGHLLEGNNLKLANKGGVIIRICKTCAKEYDRSYKIKKKATKPKTIRKKKTHCRKGHPYDDANTSLLDRKNYIQRVCKTCARERALKSFHKKGSGRHAGTALPIAR